MTFLRSGFAVFILAFLWDFQHVHSKDGFIATLPQLLRQRVESELCLTVYSSDTTDKEAAFKLVNLDTGDTDVDLEDVYTPGVQKCTSFEAPAAGKYELLIYNDTDTLHESVEVNVQGDEPLTLVQTDKPKYKPGQTVKFRILTLLHDLKPRVGEISSVYVSDPNDIRVKQYLQMDNDGLTTLEFQLVERAKLGKWTIEVSLEADSKPSTTTFEVDEYVLPRFEVSIIPPSFILVTDDVITGQVCATYTYGKPVTGVLDLSLFWGSMGSPRVIKVAPISGCHNFSVPMTELSEGRATSHYPRHYVYHGDLQIHASVTEAGTGAMVNKTQSGPRVGFEPLKINLEDNTNGMFKPGLPYFGKATVTKPDGTPATGILLSVKATTFPAATIYKQNFTSDSSGVVVFALCSTFTENSTTINLDVTAEDFRQPDHRIPTERSLYTPQNYRRIRQWFSPSLSYIQIPKLDTVQECNTELSLDIPFTTLANKDTTFTYQIMSRGQIVKTGSVEYDHSQGNTGSSSATPSPNLCLVKEQQPTPPTPPTTAAPPPPPENDEGVDEMDDIVGPPGSNSIAPFVPHMMDDGEFREPVIRSAVVSNAQASFNLDFTISAEMSPTFTLLVYHVMADGEVVADSMEFDVKPCFENNVEFQFDKEQAMPGEEVDLTLKATPGSVCGVGVVDKSVNILGGDHQITPDVVFKRIKELSQSQFNVGPWFFYNSDTEYCEERIKKLDENFRQDMYWSYSSPYVDASEAFQSSGLQVITNLDIETRPCERSFRFEYAVDGMPSPIARKGDALGGKSGSKIRSNFPESWLWDLIVVGEEGTVVSKETAPDTVTSWVGNALCMASDTGFGVSEMTSLTTFQPFFVSLQLPYAAVRGERLPVILTIYNYLEDCLNIELALNVDSEDFTLHESGRHPPSVCLCGEKSQSRRYYITPKNIGSLELVAKATIVEGSCESDTLKSNADYVGYSDGVKREMLVRAEGVKQEYSSSVYICHKVDETKSEDVNLPLPANMVKDSAAGEVKVIGDIMGPAMSNLDSLVRMPTGCGEQNMVGFVPNICVLKYLNNTGRLTEEIRVKATKHMEIGYQRELTYRHADGSYSAFGERDEKGSVWLTAFVVKSFAQAKPYIFVDDDEIALSIRFLRRSQLETGCFRETGKVFSSYMMGGLGKSKKKNSYTALTAYVLTALLQAGLDKTDQVLVDGVRCMNRDVNREKGKLDPYALSLAAYVNTLYDPTSASTVKILRSLDSRAKKDGIFRFWGRDTATPAPVTTWYYHAAPSAEVEMTSYALLALLTSYGPQAVDKIVDIAMWLSQQRNPQGGFSSTQDTVMGLQALSEFASMAYSDQGSDMAVRVSGKGLDKEFRVADELENTLLLQREPIKELPNKLTIRTSGLGCVLVQSSVSYNKPADKIQVGKPPFYLKVAPRLYHHDINRCDRRTLKFIVRLKNRKFSSGMSLLSVRMVTGWKPIEDSLLRLESRFPLLGIKQYEYKEDQGLISFYFDELSRKPKEFTLDIEQDREMTVSNPKPAEVKIYQYYETDVSLVRAYKIPTTCGTKEEIPYSRLENENAGPSGPLQVRLDISRDFPLSIQNVTQGCPKCSASKKLPENLDELICQSKAIYKGVAGRKGRKPLKFKQDMRPLRRNKVASPFASYRLPAGCDCAQLSPPSKRVIMFLREKMSGKTIQLDGSSVVVPNSRKLDREIRKRRRSCGPVPPS